MFCCERLHLTTAKTLEKQENRERGAGNPSDWIGTLRAMRSPTPTPAPEQDPHHRAAAVAAVTARRKGTASRVWMVVTASGGVHLEEVGKHSIMRRTGLPARDLRVLDPLLSYPSTILGRERAIVINLEHIKAMITATEVLIASSKEPLVASSKEALVANSKEALVAAFVQDLQSRVASSNGASQEAMESSDGDADPMAKGASSQPSPPGCNGTCYRNGEMPEGSSGPTDGVHKDGGTKVLPFEFRALEVCLESACRCLEFETSILEQEAYPALDELTSKISTLNLERVRQIKSRLVAISGRVQKVRDELEHLLDDDMDMAEMYLTEKLISQPAGVTSSRFDLDTDAAELDEDRDEDFKTETESSHGSLDNFKPNIEELEMLLEAYFVQIEGTLNKISTLREYVDDTEDYINIMLDEKQNQLLQMGVMLSTATLVVTAGVVVVGVFGMNITIDLFNAPAYKFWEATFGTIGGCIVLYILAIGWGKRSGMLQ